MLSNFKNCMIKIKKIFYKKMKALVINIEQKPFKMKLKFSKNNLKNTLNLKQYNITKKKANKF